MTKTAVVLAAWWGASSAETSKFFKSMNTRSKFLRLPVWLMAIFVSYILLVRLSPYLLERFAGFNIEPGSTYPWNFMPVMALCLFGGARFANKLWAWLMPLGAYLIGDFALWYLKGIEYAFGSHTPAVYGGFAFAIALGFLLRKADRPAPFVIGGLGLGIFGETIFFLASNGATWLFTHSTAPMNYTFDLAGLLACLGMGLPFYFRALLSTMIYGSILFGGYAMLHRWEPSEEPKLARAA